MPASVVPGDRGLPPGYDHPHASEEARRLAEDGQILRVEVGSGVHGTSVSGQDDRDEMGICLEPPAYVTGLARVPAGTSAGDRTVPFEQYERHTAWDRAGGWPTAPGLAIWTSSSTRHVSGPGSLWTAIRRCCSCCSSRTTTWSSATRSAPS